MFFTPACAIHYIRISAPFEDKPNINFLFPMSHTISCSYFPHLCHVQLISLEKLVVSQWKWDHCQWLSSLMELLWKSKTTWKHGGPCWAHCHGLFSLSVWSLLLVCDSLSHSLTGSLTDSLVWQVLLVHICVASGFPFPSSDLWPKPVATIGERGMLPAST